MPYCSECGNKVSKTDKRCSKCGHRLDEDTPEPPRPPTPGVNIVREPTEKSYHNIEFILAMIAVVLSVFALSQSLPYYSIEEPGVFLFLMVPIFIGIIGAIIIRYFAKPGAIILLIAGFMLVIFGIDNMVLAMIFYIATAAVAFYLN